MHAVFLFLAQRGADSPANQWLNKNPAVLGLIAIALGLLVGATGVYTLKTGVAKNKLGQEFKGSTATVSGVVRVVAGCAACVFGIYKIVAG